MFHRNATQVGFKLFQMRFEAKGEQQRGQRVTLVNSVRGGEPLAIAFVIPEKVKRAPLGEHRCTRGDFRNGGLKFQKAGLSVRRGESIAGIQCEKDEVWIRFREDPCRVRKTFGSSRDPHSELGATEQGTDVVFTGVTEGPA